MNVDVTRSGSTTKRTSATGTTLSSHAPQRQRRRRLLPCVRRLPAHLQPAHSRHGPLSPLKCIPHNYRFSLSSCGVSIDDYVDCCATFEVLLPTNDARPRFEHFMMACEFLCETLRLSGTPDTYTQSISFFKEAILMDPLSMWKRVYSIHNAILFVH